VADVIGVVELIVIWCDSNLSFPKTHITQYQAAKRS
jgi:hypothetical protein